VSLKFYNVEGLWFTKQRVVVVNVNYNGQHYNEDAGDTGSLVTIRPWDELEA
jgi:hypothetical protein